MALPPRRIRRPAVLALTTGLALALTGPTGVSGPAAADPPPPPPVAAGPGDGDAPVNSKPRGRDRLGRHDRELLARAQTTSSSTDGSTSSTCPLAA